MWMHASVKVFSVEENISHFTTPHVTWSRGVSWESIFSACVWGLEGGGRARKDAVSASRHLRSRAEVVTATVSV